MTKQSGDKKSLNFQLNNCDNVKIESKLINELKKRQKDREAKNMDAKERQESDIVLDYLTEKVRNGMLTILFDKTKSKKNKEAVDLAVKKFNASVVKSTVWVIIPDSKILELIGELRLLAGMIQPWVSARGYFRSRQIDPYKFIHSLIPVWTCGKKFDKISHTKHCWRSLKNEGWGCKFMSGIKRTIDKSGKGIFFYNVGHFDENNKWIIDKNMLRAALFEEIERNGYDLCPNFYKKEVMAKIDELPNVINVDGIKFKHVYDLGFRNGNMIEKPVNIQHVRELSKQEIMDRERAEKIKELEYKIGMDMLKDKELRKAKEQLLVLRGDFHKYSEVFKLELYAEKGYRYSDN